MTTRDSASGVEQTTSAHDDDLFEFLKSPLRSPAPRRRSLSCMLGGTLGEMYRGSSWFYKSISRQNIERLLFTSGPGHSDCDIINRSDLIQALRPRKEQHCDISREVEGTIVVEIFRSVHRLNNVRSRYGACGEVSV